MMCETKGELIRNIAQQFIQSNLPHSYVFSCELDKLGKHTGASQLILHYIQFNQTSQGKF